MRIRLLILFVSVILFGLGSCSEEITKPTETVRVRNDALIHVEMTKPDTTAEKTDRPKDLDGINYRREDSLADTL